MTLGASRCRRCRRFHVAHLCWRVLHRCDVALPCQRHAETPQVYQSPTPTDVRLLPVDIATHKMQKKCNTTIRIIVKCAIYSPQFFVVMSGYRHPKSCIVSIFNNFPVSGLNSTVTRSILHLLLQTLSPYTQFVVCGLWTSGVTSVFGVRGQKQWSAPPKYVTWV